MVRQSVSDGGWQVSGRLELRVCVCCSNPMEQITLCPDSTTCYCHRTTCSESLRWFIHLCLFTDKTPQWAWSPMGLALPGKRVAYCTQQDGSYAGLLGREIWPAWISPAGWNREIQAWRDRQGVEDRVHQSLLRTLTPEKPEKKLLRFMVCLVEHTPVEHETPHTSATC